jgi:PAS domain S-box-containing protein
VVDRDQSKEQTTMDDGTTTSPELLMLKRAVESTSNGICITDPRLPDNPIIYVNPAFMTMTGYRADQILGRNCRFLQRDDRDQSAIQMLREAIKKEMAITVTLRNYRRDGSIFYNELTVSPVHDERGRLINFVGVQNDISARIEAEKRVSEFYSVISHELRTPLTAINGALSVMADGSTGKLNAKALRMVNIALDNSERLIRLISDILDWKKIESGKFKLKLGPAHPAEMVEKVIDAVRLLATTANITIDKNIMTHKSIVIDEDRVIQVLINLVDNAIKFSPPASSVTITVNCPTPDTTRFAITDSGEGIAQKDLKNLFKLFQQLDSSDTRQRGGTGLGLAISRSLVELHGGQIGVTSELGKGSTFWFEFYSDR